MEEYQSIIGIISLTMGASWASGINLYAALLMLGVGGATGNIELPPGLETLENPLVIMAAGVMYVSEFVVDKIPGIDTSWDAIHTFIRIPAGALLAMGTVGEMGPAVEIAAAIMGGGMSATSHGMKSGARLAINTSPEPFTNWGMSVGEDVAVFAGLWAALTHPVVFLVFLAVFILLAIWLLPKIWKGVKFIFLKLGQLFGLVEKNSSQHAMTKTQSTLSPSGISASSDNPVTNNSDITSEIARLKLLLDDGAITADEFVMLKDRLLSSGS